MSKLGQAKNTFNKTAQQDSQNNKNQAKRLTNEQVMVIGKTGQQGKSKDVGQIMGQMGHFEIDFQ